MFENVKYGCLPGYSAATDDILIEKCAALYSTHYGIWGENGIRPGQTIKLSKEKIGIWLQNNDVAIYYATIQDNLIGYAIIFSMNIKNYGRVIWITQLVVHSDYRNRGIAKNILFSIWGFSNHYAGGIVSANPYAIRALEKATRRRAVPIRIKKNHIKLRNIGRDNVPFIQNDTTVKVTEDLSVINTQFFVDYSNKKEMIANVTKEDSPWLLGMIEEGWEWFAFTFHDQGKIFLTKEEIEHLLEISDSMVKKVYSKMTLNSKKQIWMRHTKEEINFIMKKTASKPNEFLYDLGCSMGRHGIKLVKRSFQVVGLDYISENVKIANQKIKVLALNNINIYKKVSVVLCFNHVVGTFYDNKENLKIINTAYQLLKANGIAIFSVMNYELILANAKHTFIFEQDANKLFDLTITTTREKSGDVFKSDSYIVDTETHLVYRKEQFFIENELPIELVVRDKSFTMDEIISLCESVGFSVIENKYSNVSDWNKEYIATDSCAKEILLVCKKTL